MRKLFVFLLTAVTIVCLLGAIGLGFLLFKFNPNDYKSQFQAALEEATGWEITLHDDLSINFLPDITLTTGRMSVEIPGNRNGQSAHVEALTLYLSGKHLHQGYLDVEKVLIHEMTLNQDSVPESLLPDDGSNPAINDALRSLAVQGDKATAPMPEESGQPVPAGAPSEPGGMRLQVRYPGRQLTVVDSAITGKDAKGNDTWNLFIFRADFLNIGLNSDIMATAEGTFSDPLNLKKTGFSLETVARLSDNGALRGHISTLRLHLEGFGDLPLAAEGAVTLDYNLHTGAVSFTDMAGKISLAGRVADDPSQHTAFRGSLAIVPAKEGLAGTITGSLAASGLDLDMLLHGLDPSVRFIESDTESIKGAPNFTRPTVTRVLATATGMQLPTSGKHEYPSIAQTPKKADTPPLLALLAAKYSLSLDLGADTLVTYGLQLDNLAMQARSSGGRGSLPFSFSAYGGQFTGTAGFSLGGSAPAIALNSQFKSVNMGKLSAIWTSNYYIGGVGSGFVNVAGQGNSGSAMINSLKGKAAFQVKNGEVKGFTLIPPDLPYFENLPENFLFRTLSASMEIEGGKAATQDILMDSDILQAKGSGVIHLSFGQLDLGLSFSQEGRQATVPVFIHGPYASLSSTVDMARYNHSLDQYGVNQYYDGYRSPYQDGAQGAYGQQQGTYGQDPYRQPPPGQSGYAIQPQQIDPYQRYLNRTPLSGVQWQNQNRQAAPPPLPGSGGQGPSPQGGGMPAPPQGQMPPQQYERQGSGKIAPLGNPADIIYGR